MSNKIIFSPEQEEKILYSYTALNKSMQKISKEFNVDDSVIKRILKNNNIKIKSNDFYKNKRIDSDFFENIDTENKAYVLGFLYADGSLSKTGVVNIKQKEPELLYKIKEALKSEHKIGKSISNNGYNKGKEYYYFCFKNQKITNDLIKIGFTPDKTHFCYFPYDFVPENLYPHFIRGFFDGDGSVYLTHGKRCPNYIGISISFTGTYEMLNSIKNILGKITGSQAKIYDVFEKKGAYDYKIGGKT